MKKILFAAISLCIAATAATSTLTASAAGILSEPEYPEIFDDTLIFNNLTDFAIANENLMIFADGKTIVHWKNENVTIFGDGGESGKEVKFETAVTDVDYDPVGNKFYYSLDGGKTGYVLPDSPDKLPGEQVEHNFSSPHITETSRDFGGNYLYYYDSNGNFIAHDKVNKVTNDRLPISNAKIYADKLYGIANHSLLYEVIGLNSSQVRISYSNYNKLEYIFPGDIPEKLSTYQTFSDNPQFVLINSDAYLTEINSNGLTYTHVDESGNEYEYISVIDTKNLHEALRGEVALLLYQSEKVKIVARGKGAYIMRADGASELNYNIMVPVDERSTATLNVAGEYAHSMPYMSNATRTFALAPNEVVTVIGKAPKENSPLAHTFYLIENTNGERGYVIDEFLSDFNVPVPDESGATVTPDPESHTDDYVKTVVLIIVVILLVLIAVGYITWVCTTKHNKVAKTKDGEIKMDDGDDKPAE